MEMGYRPADGDRCADTGAASDWLENHPQAGGSVAGNLSVGGHDFEFFHHRLRNQDSIKRIFVVER